MLTGVMAALTGYPFKGRVSSSDSTANGAPSVSGQGEPTARLWPLPLTDDGQRREIGDNGGPALQPPAGGSATLEPASPAFEERWSAIEHSLMASLRAAAWSEGDPDELLFHELEGITRRHTHMLHRAALTLPSLGLPGGSQAGVRLETLLAEAQDAEQRTRSPQARPPITPNTPSRQPRTPLRAQPSWMLPPGSAARVSRTGTRGAAQQEAAVSESARAASLAAERRVRAAAVAVARSSPQQTRAASSPPIVERWRTQPQLPVRGTPPPASAQRLPPLRAASPVPIVGVVFPARPGSRASSPTMLGRVSSPTVLGIGPPGRSLSPPPPLLRPPYSCSRSSSPNLSAAAAAEWRAERRVRLSERATGAAMALTGGSGGRASV